MAYQSEADFWRGQFEQQKDIAIRLGIENADLRQWNLRLADESIRMRDQQWKMRNELIDLRTGWMPVIALVMIIVLWSVTH